MSFANLTLTLKTISSRQMSSNRNFFSITFLLLFIFSLQLPGHAEQIALEKDNEGWTIFKPSADSRIVYISQEGDDSTAQYYSISDEEINSDPYKPNTNIRAFATFSAAYAVTRNNYPDWILFKRGDTYNFSVNAVRSGRSSTEPFYIGAYGEAGSPPKFNQGTSFGLSISNTSSSNPKETKYFAVSSLQFYANSRDPQNTTDYLGPAGNFGLKLNAYGLGNSINSSLIEGCEFIFQMNNGVTADGGGSISEVTLRRNKFIFSYPDTAHSQGLWANKVNNFILEENIFDHNGWYSKEGEDGIGTGTVFNHNTYFAGAKNTTFINNIFMRGSNMNNKFTSPYGDSSNINIIDNLYISGNIGIGIGTNYLNISDRFQDITIKDNILTNLGIDNVTGQGIAWYLQISGWKHGIVTGNILMNQIGQVEPNGSNGIEIWSDSNDVVISNNVFYNIQDTNAYFLKAGSETATFSFYKNKIYATGKNPILAKISAGTSAQFENQWFSSSDTPQFLVDSGNKTFPEYKDLTNDKSNTSYGDNIFPDPTRSIETYMNSLGKKATIDAFITAVTSQNRFNWDPQLEAKNVNAWIRQGFLGNVSPPANFMKASTE